MSVRQRVKAGHEGLLGGVIGIPKRRRSDRLNDRDQVFCPVHDFPHQHLLLFFGLLASGNVLPGNYQPSYLALIIPPRPDVALQPEGPSVRQLKMVRSGKFSFPLKTALVAFSPFAWNLGKHVVVAAPDDALRQAKVLHPSPANRKVSHIPIEHHNRGWCMLDKEPEALLTCTQMFQHRLSLKLAL